jgi:hypothetical protein
MLGVLLRPPGQPGLWQVVTYASSVPIKAPAFSSLCWIHTVNRATLAVKKQVDSPPSILTMQQSLGREYAALALRAAKL